MNKQERQEFIDRMEEIGDIWEDDDVKRVYGKKSLDEALSDRMNDISTLAGFIGIFLNS